MRRWLLGIGTVLLSGALIMAFLGHSNQAFFAGSAWLAILVLGLAFERVTYKADLPAPPGAPWTRTAETSVEDGHVVEVWAHPQTGERAYVRAGGK